MPLLTPTHTVVGERQRTMANCGCRIFLCWRFLANSGELTDENS